MKILESARGNAGGQPEFMSTHPNPGNRINELLSIIKQEYPNGVPNQLEVGENRFAQIVSPRL